MAISKNLKLLYNSIFDGVETWVANRISDIIEIKNLYKYKPNSRPSKEYKKAVKQFWGKYSNISPKWGWYYASRNKNYDPRYIPNTLIYTKIDQYFNNKKAGYGFNDKNYYDLIFKSVKQPDTLVRNINGIFVDRQYHLIPKDDIINIIKAEEHLICKPSMESGSGRGICFWNTRNDINAIVEYINDKTEKNYIIQKLIKQHPDLEEVHRGSINTIRIVSLLNQDGTHILSSNLRMGVGESKIDNVTAGGISCGINIDGTLKKYATSYYAGEHFAQHPQGFIFEGKTIPSFHKIVDIIKDIHQQIPHFRLVSWDFAVDIEGEPILIEANMRKGGINLNQFNNGPLFGDLTETVLDEVYSK